MTEFVLTRELFKKAIRKQGCFVTMTCFCGKDCGFAYNKEDNQIYYESGCWCVRRPTRPYVCDDTQFDFWVRENAERVRPFVSKVLTADELK